MPALELPSLTDLFNQLESCKNEKTKSELLTKAKYFILNKMSDEQIIEFFILKESCIENLFTLDIWTPHSDESIQISRFTEPYEIIEKLFYCFNSILDLMEKFSTKIYLIINQSKDEKCKHICLSQLLRLINQLQLKDFESDSNKSKEMLEIYLKDLLSVLTKEIKNTAVGYSQLLGEFICATIIKFNQLESFSNKLDTFSEKIFFENSTLIDEFNVLFEKNSIISFRVFEIIIKISSVSSRHLMLVSETKFNLSKKIENYLNHTADVLSTLNCIELIRNLAVSEHGFEYLEKNGHLQILINKLETDDDPFGVFLLPSIVKFFSHVSKKMPFKVNEKFSKFYIVLFYNAFRENIVKNEQEINLSIETFAYLFESNLVKKFFFENYSTNFNELLDKLIWINQNSINENLKSNSLKCIAEIIACDPMLLDTDKTDTKWLTSVEALDWIENEELSKSFYEILVTKCTHENLFNTILTLAKEPFKETRLAAQLYFKALAQTKWGMSALFSGTKQTTTQTFIDNYLLKRSIEIEKQGLESKFELVKLMVVNFKKNFDLLHLIGEMNLEKLEAYVRQGPFYSGEEMKITFENN